ncbi:methyl-accepting chemotaxis protein [Anaerospora hongkongensis]|uniref:Methyl-accepting chemotaxis protein n=1 Tax=Anaerospora hongkongensis TaxID=244830 RepID=A0A4V2Q8T1_9FIRM|nr:methyl-accepting chemotaxis protein [Anaerospora hongkongensis]TCL38167.1 methyl-accepting chemotaxis protein [Anaerospora hongkongensis]
MRFTIGKQILTVSLLVVLAFTGLNLYTYYQLQVIEQGYDGVIQRSVPLVVEVKNLNIEVKAQAAAVRGYIISGDRKYVSEYEQSTKAVKTTMDSLEKKLITPEGKEKVTGLRNALAEYNRVADQTIVTRTEKGLADAALVMNTAKEKNEIAEKLMVDTVAFLTERMDLRTEQNKNLADSIERIIIILDVIILVCAIAGSTWLMRRISRPLADVVTAAHDIADGDLQIKQIRYAGDDEIGDLLKAFSHMAKNLQEIVTHVSRSAEQVAAASEQLTASADQSALAAGQVAETITSVAAGAYTQGTTVEHTADIVQEMARAIGHIAENSSTVSARSAETSKAATIGSQAMQQATDQMQAINRSVSQSAEVVGKLGESSKQIGEIVDVISGIAGQTNLLALNAAIEAARAGEQGRGFAVVADEVRKLAEQSHEAAQKIAHIVREIQAETTSVVTVMQQGTVDVARGSEVIISTGERFTAIVSLVENLNSEIQEITAASEQLSASSEEVVKSVESVKQLAGETAANTQTISAAAEEQSASMEEIAASSQALSRLADELQMVVRKFKI